MMLVQAAANEWKVEPSTCTVVEGRDHPRRLRPHDHLRQGRGSGGKLEAPKDVPLKDIKSWTIAGKPLKRLDTPDKVNGKLVYAIDVKLPGMLNAALKKCPVFGGKIKSFDAAKVEKMPGVKKVVQVADTGVAVVADTWWRAKTALDALPIEWDIGPNASVQNADDRRRAEGRSDRASRPSSATRPATSRARSPAPRARSKRCTACRGQHHVTMEPMTATALWTESKCEVWTSTQNGEAALATATQASGLPTDKNEVYRHHLGGGFGRRATSHDFVRYAVLIAKQMPGVPIKTIWSREEDMTHGVYHPITQCRLVGGFDANSNLVALHMRISGQSILAGVNPERAAERPRSRAVPGPQSARAGRPVRLHHPEPADRPCDAQPACAAGLLARRQQQPECDLSRMLHRRAGALRPSIDPLEFRRKLMANHPKHLAVLNAVADKGGWGKPAPAGVFRGLAQHMGYGSYVAACAEVSVSDAGVLKIHRIVAATDCGNAVNPQQIEAQIEGSFVYGLTALLYGDITVKDGRVEQENFDTYQMMRMDEMPAVEKIVMPSGDFWGGVGEPTICVAAPAVLNAIFAATGKRIRQTPLSKADLRKA